MGKALEKQTKTIQDQGEKQVDALEHVRPKELEVIKSNEDVGKIDIIFNDLFNKIMSGIHDLTTQIDFNNLTYKFKGEKKCSNKFYCFYRSSTSL